MNDLKLIIFDFDGTIADTMAAGIQIANQLAKQLNIKPLDSNKIDYYRTLEPKQLLKELGLPLIKLPILASLFHIEFNKIIHQLKPFDQIPQLLPKLYEQYTLGILSSNSKENITKFLRANGLEQYFDFIHSQPHIFGKSSSLRRILRRNKLKPHQAIYIGDEVRDIQAAQQVGMPIIAVTWGMNARSLLQRYNPQFLVDSPMEILTRIQN